MHNRAYSLLHVKAIDADKRVISGVATTPEPDRMGDIIEPMGATFANPLPLLLFHDSHKPVGTVRFSKPTKQGIEFEASLPTIDEPGSLKDRVDEAWQSVKAGLITAVSIGFRGIETAFMQNGGIHFLKTEILELSLVVIPANQDATIASVKSLDTGRPRQVTPVVVHAITPGASGTSSRAGTTMKTIQEQISAFESTRQAKSARMTELMTTAGEAGVTLDEAQTQEYDGLAAEIKAVDAHLVRLTALDVENKKAAKPANGATQEEAALSRGGVQVSVKDNQLPPGIAFARYAMCLAAAKGNVPQALAIAQKRFPDASLMHLVLKEAVSAGTTTDPDWAGTLVNYQDFTGDFIEFLRPQTILGKFGMNGIPALRSIPFNVRIQEQTSGGSGYWVGQGKAKPLTKFDFAPTTLRWAKVANIAVLTEELVRFSSPSAERLVRDALAAALIERLDIDFVDPMKAAVADVSPASITHGVTPITSMGYDAAAVRADIANVMAPFIAANITPTNGVWIMNATTALALSLMRNALGQKEFADITMTGGRLEGLPVIVSQYVGVSTSPTDNIVILANASDIYLADDGQVVIDASREASLEMDDAPTSSVGTDGSPAGAVGTTLVSLWQTNAIGLRAERFINWSKRRAAAVQYLDHVSWSSSGTSPV